MPAGSGSGKWRALTSIAALAIGGVAVAARADVEGELRAELVGRYALTRAALTSECTDHYTDVDVVGGRPTGGKGVRFAAGELVRVDNVKIGTFSGLDVNLSLEVPYLYSFTDGPFTLYEQRRCRVQLNFEADREVKRDARRALAAIAGALELFDGEAAARAAGWNRRETGTFPDGYEETVRQHGIWEVRQVNAAVRARTDELLALAARALRDLPSDAEALAAFGGGARERDDSWSGCPAMLDASFYPSSAAKKKPAAWVEGERVAWATRLARELQRCYLEEPR